MQLRAQGIPSPRSVTVVPGQLQEWCNLVAKPLLSWAPSVGASSKVFWGEAEGFHCSKAPGMSLQGSRWRLAPGKAPRLCASPHAPRLGPPAHLHPPWHGWDRSQPASPTGARLGAGTPLPWQPPRTAHTQPRVAGSLRSAGAGRKPGGGLFSFPFLISIFYPTPTQARKYKQRAPSGLVLPHRQGVASPASGVGWIEDPSSPPR